MGEYLTLALAANSLPADSKYNHFFLGSKMQPSLLARDFLISYSPTGRKPSLSENIFPFED
jgi:hypothetical protein